MAKTKPTLEDYIFDMETRPPDHGTTADQDLWTQLQKKESDLLLAAELGKALLEKNEELAKQQERIIEEYSKKLEVSTRIESFLFCLFLVPQIAYTIYTNGKLVPVARRRDGRAHWRFAICHVPGAWCEYSKLPSHAEDIVGTCN